MWPRERRTEETHRHRTHSGLFPSRFPTLPIPGPVSAHYASPALAVIVAIISAATIISCHFKDPFPFPPISSMI
ncbi:hypothetical protein E2C01_101053 [Portunus trituberculatus]|uniref:Uncharacterized protein n=1 Tax=Portunus trituberculatus TaxID=210409 RepID=A0A5B7KF51_PORTR|nr:hypothetical protein [Portunus trituberculatus]